MTTVYTSSFETPLGTFHAAATDRGLALLMLPGTTEKEFESTLKKLYPDCERSTGGVVLDKTEYEINAYLAGSLTRFTVEVDWTGTPFSRQVLKEVSRIPYGETRTYGEVASKIGKPKAFRAVGSANAHNAVPIVVPCHRVIATGGLGGYGGGLPMKEKLLKLEGAL